MLNTHFVFYVKIGAFDEQSFSLWGETNLGSDQLGMENSGEAVDDDDGSGWFEVKKVFYLFILFLAWFFFFFHHQLVSIMSIEWYISCKLLRGMK